VAWVSIQGGKGHTALLGILGYRQTRDQFFEIQESLKVQITDAGGCTI